jgi:hypothetical protein
MDAQADLWQVLPHLPGSNDGVGDYSLTLARQLYALYGLRTTFIVAASTSVREKEGFSVVSGLDADQSSSSVRLPVHVILHYANYGYQRRGVPFRLRRFARDLRGRLAGRWITTFHELYASGPPWRSAFWVRPLQVKIARDLMDLSNSCVASNEVIRREINRHDARKPVYVVPMMSNFGEPPWPIPVQKSPKRWAIAGGTALIERSLRAFAKIKPAIPGSYFPDEVEVVGGVENQPLRDQLRVLRQVFPEVSFRHHPQVTADRASTILAPCAFGWLDYFGDGKAWPGMILKSGSFAAFCAHGIVPVLSHEERELSAGGDSFPGPFHISAAATSLPTPENLANIQQMVRAWYDRNASSTRTAQIYAEALK